jgi:hypothetical protein
MRGPELVFFISSHTADSNFGAKFHCQTIQVSIWEQQTSTARLAQSVEHETLNLRVVGSSPTLGASFLCFKQVCTVDVPDVLSFCQHLGAVA